MTPTPLSRPQPAPKSRITVPALPRLPAADDTMSSPHERSPPFNASEFLQSALCSDLAGINIDENGGVKLSTTPDGTPPRSRSPKRKHSFSTINTPYIIGPCNAPGARLEKFELSEHNRAARCLKKTTNTSVLETEAEPSSVLDNITPPDSRYAVTGPVVLDASIYQDLASERTEQPSSPADVVKPHLPDDPFISSPVGQVQTIPNPAAMPNQHILSLINANLAYSRDISSSLPRRDRLGQPVGAHNAQGLFPARAVVCVFNLSNLKTADQLQLSVENVFGVFGTCYIKIKSDVRHQPNAIIQYELIADAEKALRDGNGCMIDGRIVRVEKGNVPRSMIVSLLNNSPFAEAQLRDTLVDQGQIESIAPTGPMIASGQDNMAYVVKFEYFEDCKDALKTFRHNSVWRVVPAPKEKRASPYPLAAPRTPQGTLYEDNDRYSIFLGSLPDSVTEEEVRAVLDMFGTIESVNVISKPMTTGGMNTFAFVSFKYAEDAESAANSTQFLRGQKIRVERKQYAKRRAARVASALGPASALTNTPRTAQYVGHGNGFGMGLTSHPVTPYNTGGHGFTFSDYNTTPPTPVYMASYGQYASPLQLGQRVHIPPTRLDSHQMLPPMHFANFQPQNSGAFGPGAVNFGSMNVIAEERESCVFD